MELETTFICAFCLSVNEILVDTTGGLSQEYVEDCQVCCRPNTLHIAIDAELSAAEVMADPA